MVTETAGTLLGYTAHYRVQGTQPLLFGRVGRDSAQLEDQVYRSIRTLTLVVPAEHFRMSIVNNAKGLFNRNIAGTLPLPEGVKWGSLSQFLYETLSFNDHDVLLFDAEGVMVKTWDGVDERYVVENDSPHIVRRPYLNTGWTADLLITSSDPNRLPVELLHMLLTHAGSVDGVGTFRQQFGGFVVDDTRSYGVTMRTVRYEERVISDTGE